MLENLFLPGVNREIGIENCGQSEELFLEMLGDYRGMIPTKIAQVRGLLEAGDIENYVIEVHALKSTSRMVGIMDLGEEFFELELAGKAGDVALLQAKTPGVLRRYEDYLMILAPFANDADGGEIFSEEAHTLAKPVNTTRENATSASVAPRNPNEIPLEKFASDLKKVSAAMDSFDLDEVDRIMKELNQAVIPERYQQDFRNLARR